MNRDFTGSCLRYMYEHMNAHRRNHTFGVVDTAKKYAEIYGADVSKAEIAALLHDFAKPLSQEDSDREVLKYGLPEYMLGNRNLAHGPIAARWAEERYEIEDREILDAIYYHTSARKDMTLLDKIVFVADTVEPGRTYAEASMLNERAESDLQGVYEYIIEWMIGDLKSKGISPGPDTLDAVKEIENGK